MIHAQTKTIKYSFVLPIYNEEETLARLYEEMTLLMNALDGPAEAILVDDGSRDRSYALMLELHQKDPRFRTVRLSRNFGHQTAISAGLDFVSGEATIVMDADLQDPPEAVHRMIAKWKEGYEMVYAIREKREGETFFKKFTASLYYRILGRLTEVEIPQDVGDFRLIDRKALDAFKALRESNRYVRGMFSWVGFRQTGITYRREKRLAGATKYPFRKMLSLATNGIISFSNVPLRTVLTLGFWVSAISFLGGVTAIYLKVSGAYTVRGWTSLAVFVSFIGGAQLIVLGILGIYLGRIYDEVRNRPLYIVRDLRGLSSNLSAQRPLPAWHLSSHSPVLPLHPSSNDAIRNTESLDSEKNSSKNQSNPLSN